MHVLTYTFMPLPLQVCAPRQCNVSLLAYSPLAGGALSGKYIDGDAKTLEKARFSLFKGEPLQN